MYPPPDFSQDELIEQISLNSTRDTDLDLYQVMDPQPLLISPDTSVLDAVVLMNQKRNHGHPGSQFPQSGNCYTDSDTKWEVTGYVLIQTDKKLLGIFTLTDLARVVASGSNLAETKIVEVMTQPVTTLKLSNISNVLNIGTLVSTFSRNEIDHLPVIDDQGKVVGIIRQRVLWKQLDPGKDANGIQRLTEQVNIQEELQQTIEELQIIEEELRQQNQQLVIAHELAELEKTRYHQLFELTPYCYLVTDKVGIIKNANRTASTLLSVEKQYLIGKPIIVFIAPKYRQQFTCQIADFQPQQESPEQEIYLQPRKGKLFPASVKIVGIYDPHKKEHSWIWLINNISDRKKAEQELEQKVAKRTEELVQLNETLQAEIKQHQKTEIALRESETRLTLALEVAKMGIWDWNLITNDHMWSESVGPMYGLPRGTISPSCYEDLLKLIHPEDAEVLSNQLRIALDNKSGFNIEFRAIWPDGSLHWLTSTAQVFCNEKGEATRMIGTVQNISTYKQKEQKLYEQAALLDIATDAIFVRDFQTEILFWNQGALRIYGWTKEEAIGKHLRDLFCQKTAMKQEVIALKAVVRSGSWQGVLRKYKKSGEQVTVESRWTLMFDGDGQPKSILIVDTDITDKKQLEEQFLRTQRLESIGTLACGIAHDLNNILTPILGSAQLLKRKSLQDHITHPQLLTMIEDNATRASSLVKQVFSFAKGASNEWTIVQIKHLILEIVNLAKHTFPKSIKLKTKIANNLSTVFGDSTELYQIMINLVVNALNAMPSGGVLTIAAENTFIDGNNLINEKLQQGHYILITIIDTGIGMSQAVADKIFEPFFTTKENGLGSGIGLSIVSRIIQKHNGYLQFYTQQGQGSKFEVFLPSIEAPHPPLPQELPTEIGRGELILIVDDEPQIRDVTRMILETHNYDTLTASNGMEAIAIYGQYKQDISVVLMDIMMPKIDGIATIQAMKKINPLVKIIACSGISTIEAIPKSANMKIQGVLLKPYSASDLLSSMSMVIRGDSSPMNFLN
ncbi:PAS domain S-box protein [Cylindrospermopsis sp. CR12]|uniref:PAS domain S-box protein n=1 Tax=Cylindrospermopsis TaxID=77021 RepID=UPI00070C488F|nr:PAS domain S-box protein [Cylindrospermopsis sp. CR12]KRH96980.1 histidine kinase [Cylindrospermopsis sp. CR12]